MNSLSIPTLLQSFGFEVVRTGLLDGLKAFPGVDKTHVDLLVYDSNFHVGELMKDEQVSSASEILAVPFDTAIPSTGTHVLWNIRLKTGQSLLMDLSVETRPNTGGEKDLSGFVYYVEQEPFVPFVEEYVLESLRYTLMLGMKSQLTIIKQNIDLLLNGLPSKRAFSLKDDFRSAFLSEEVQESINS